MQMLTFDNFTDYLVPMTMLRRDPNGVAKKAYDYGQVIVTKGGQPFLQINALNKAKIDYSEQINALAGGLHLGSDLTAEKMNKMLDERYANMLS